MRASLSPACTAEEGIWNPDNLFPAVRVRPPLNPEDPGYDLIPQRFQRSMVQVTSSTNLAIDAPQGKKLFVFDRVFGPDVDQEGIWEYLNDCVNSFTQGYNVSLLAYGQSGAGKSYTMGTSGPAEQGDLEVMGTWLCTCSQHLVLPARASSYRGKANHIVLSRCYPACGHGTFREA